MRGTRYISIISNIYLIFEKCVLKGFLFHVLQNVSVSMELVMRESMEMDHVCVVMAGKEHFVMNVSCSLTCYRQLGSSEYWQVYGKLLF